MTREEKIEWMREWCGNHGLYLELDGEVGFGRECVGVLDEGHEYVDWDYGTPRSDPNDGTGPRSEAPNAYHKHNCIAVLGTGEEAERELFSWLQRLAGQNAVIAKGVPKEVEDGGWIFFGKKTRTVAVLPSRAELIMGGVTCSSAMSASRTSRARR